MYEYIEIKYSLNHLFCSYIFQSSSARDSTPEPPPLTKTKQKKNKSRNLTSLIMPKVDDELNSDEFELTSKSRAYKKIKGSGGDTVKLK